MSTDYSFIWNQVGPGWIEFVRYNPHAIQIRNQVLKPVLDALLGPVAGKKILDAGCGEGDLSRWLARKGASVTGIDISDLLLNAAQEEEQRDALGIRYLKRSILDPGDLADFDGVLSSQVLSVVPDHAEAFRSLFRVLKQGGHAVVSVLHPFFDGVGAGWVQDQQGNVRWWAHRYMARVSGYAAHGAPIFHRSFSDYITTALAAGFVLTGFSEPVASEEFTRTQPPWTWAWDHVPTLAVFKFTKISESHTFPSSK